MARRPAGAADWLREALIARRALIVQRFDCVETRARLEDYSAHVRSGAELIIGADTLLLTLHPIDADAAARFARTNRPASRWMLTSSNELQAMDQKR